MSYYSENDKYYMDFKDEDGNKVTFEVIAEIFIDDKKYLILGDDKDSTEDSYVVREDLVDGNVEYNFLEDEEEFLRVKKQYKKIIYG
ncbi:DUF1292 domain-containing protein [Candidatus Arthromitus sp. SFB-turkey]|uniref:DUF1292 domain-containing protein n=1 Tax=Candidatus Arthromitus sp. SFB-turkey TaxID=1840217 RepID=UPI0007F3B2B2|nr:DUF1292 domain-containing protein [Candidatus Arthromitus sp. SFB-turkey]OAT87005.1 hypothetical protein A6P36_01810 [Candidatus Arthromitus sp. SFB-turkey]HJD00774.1 DUF1292 domain-containing protein [Candidatus Dwaynia gallinarum]